MNMNKYDKMVACNRKISNEKIRRANQVIWDMLEDCERITVAKLIERTGLSRGFFYKNPQVRKELDRAMEEQSSMADPRRKIFDMAAYQELECLHQQFGELKRENERLRQENERLIKAVEHRNKNTIRNL